MNEDILLGKWKQIKGDIKERWGKLTDDDLTVIEGKRDKFLGILQERYGYSKEEAERSIDEFLGSYTSKEV